MSYPQGVSPGIERGDRSNGIMNEDYGDHLTPRPSMLDHVPDKEIKPVGNQKVKFSEKLYHLIQNPATDHLIKWESDGKHFVVLNEQGLMDIAGFQTKKFTSLHRQLTGYEIHKKRAPGDGTEVGYGVYYHGPGKLLRDREDLLCEVRRNQKGKHAVEQDAEPAPETKTVSPSGPSIGQIEAPQCCKEALAKHQHQITVLTERVKRLERLEPLVNFLLNKIGQMCSHSTQNGRSSTKGRMILQQTAPYQASMDLSMRPVANEGNGQPVLNPPVQGLPPQSQTSSQSQKEFSFAVGNVPTSNDYSAGDVFGNQVQLNHPSNPSYPPPNFSPNHPPTQSSAGPALSGLARDWTGSNTSAGPNEECMRASKRRRKKSGNTPLGTSFIPMNSLGSLVPFPPHPALNSHSHHTSLGTNQISLPTGMGDNCSSSIDPTWRNLYCLDPPVNMSEFSLAAPSTDPQFSHFAQPMMELPPRKPPFYGPRSSHQL
ncbi:kinase-regulated stress-responsive transcription factor skn7 [Tulasnella sp. 332]|nr:kinase-regulated stress-responsive transcription factor skn7 [Tulasnella sp. 332]